MIRIIKKKILVTLSVLMCVLCDVCAQGASSGEPRIKIYGNVYGGGELAQVLAPEEEVATHLLTDDMMSTLLAADHTYTTYVHLGGSSEVYGQVFGGGKGQHDSEGETAGRVTGQTGVVLNGAIVWSELFGGGQMADVRGNTLLHFKKGKTGHNAFGGGLGVLGGMPENPESSRSVSASADIRLIPTDYELLSNDNAENLTSLKALYNNDGTIRNSDDWLENTGQSFVVVDGSEETGYTHYEFEKSRTVERDANGFAVMQGDGRYYTETDQYQPENTERPFSINHNIYGGGMTASRIESKTYVYVNYGMVNEDMMNYTRDGLKVWDKMYNSDASAQFCVFGGGYGYHTNILGDANVTFNIDGDGTFRYLNAFKEAFIADEGRGLWTAPARIYESADKAVWSHGAPGRSCMDIVGGGFNGKVLGDVNVTVGGDVVVRKVYGGGYYSSVGNTRLNIKSGLFKQVYGGGMIGNVQGKAVTTFGQQYDGVNDANIRAHNAQLLVKEALYGGNDVSGTVGTSEPQELENPITHVRYDAFSPVDDDDHGVRLNVFGGLIIGDLYGAGNGNHPGYFNPDDMKYDQSQHPSENYRYITASGKGNEDATMPVYKYRPRTARMELTIRGNEGTGFDDTPMIDKVRIWGRTFGGGNSCNVGMWDVSRDDDAEVYDNETPSNSKHPGDNFLGEGTMRVTIGSHVQLGNRNDSHATPNGLFMGCSGENMVTQHLDMDSVSTYHWYYDESTSLYWPGFKVYADGGTTPIRRRTGLVAFKAFINPILTWTDNITLDIDNDVTDVWMSNFVGGGYRGSMKAKTQAGRFAYTLPTGVTVGHSVVGGAFNANIVYRIFDTDAEGNYVINDNKYGYRTDTHGLTEGEDGDYLGVLHEDPAHPDAVTGILRYNFNGGMLSEDYVTPVSPRVHAVHNPANTSTNDFVIGGGFNANKSRALVSLNLYNQLNPIVNNKGTEHENVHGGIVYGGCFNSGMVEGDTWVDYRCSLSPMSQDVRDNKNKGKYFDRTNPDVYLHASDMEKHNALLVFGAGYGANTHTDGDVYLRLLYNGEDSENKRYPLIYNAFGGGNMGGVRGNTNVFYNTGNDGTLLGSIYGGGYQGAIYGNTYLEMAGGLVINAYGGSRQADIEGAAHVWAYDGNKIPDGETDGLPVGAEAERAPLLVGNLYGGNDISGEIRGGQTPYYAGLAWNDLQSKSLNTYIQIASTGRDELSRGFPLVGNLYAGGNGAETANPADVPDVATSLLHITGGTTLRAFGGGNKATITQDANILVKAPTDVFTEHPFTEFQKEVLEQTVFKDVLTGYRWSGNDGNTLIMDPYHIVKLYGGNNIADMSVRPNWNLVDGKLEKVYSGGNMGNMTNPQGIQIDVSSDQIYINSLFGGCRMADVTPTLQAGDDEDEFNAYWNLEDSYGATVNISRGYVNNVYGGNDVSGSVAHGTDVNISGGILGNVYGSGNGDYVYQWSNEVDRVTEARDEGDADVYYKVPGTLDLGGASATQQVKKLLSINTYRPSVEKARLSISGTQENVAYVKGNVYCGGNASTVEGGEESGTEIHIGSNAVLNGVFMGSDGKHFSSQAVINAFEEKNGFDMTYMLSDAERASGTGVVGAMSPYYDSMLALYMRAVEMMAEPKIISYADGINNTFIGTFCGGGDRGSMLVNKRVDMTIPSGIKVYDKIIAGCSDANVTYAGKSGTVTTIGGFMRPVFGNVGSDTRKFNYTIACDFTPKKMYVPSAPGESITVDGTLYTFEQARSRNFLFDNLTTINGQPAYGDGCNIYGGCFKSGYVIGDVILNVKSNMLKEALVNNETKARLNASSAGEVACFNVYGAGFDMSSMVFGNVNITLDNSIDGVAPGNYTDTHPSCNNIYGGGRNGILVGNASINVLNGIVYRHVIGGSDAGYLYGSTQIAVGDPTSWKCNTTGTYILNRADRWNTGLENHDGTKPVVDEIKLVKGDIISDAIYNALENKSSFVANTTEGSMDWTNRQIYIGGGIYGGGYALASGSTIYAGDKTVRMYAGDGFKPVDPLRGMPIAEDVTGFGGNATIMIADATANFSGNDVHDHITISTLVSEQKSNPSNKMGLFTREATGAMDALGNPIHTYDHQSEGTPTLGTQYYEVSGEGGLYGDGHLSFVEGFRSADVQRYGYADYTPQSAKLLNTMQRLDLVRLKDCCIMLQGARDFATNAVDATTYSISRIRELRMESSIASDATLNPGVAPSSDAEIAASADRRHATKRMRNYIGFFNNVHYIGAIVTNDDFDNAVRHDEMGVAQANTYKAYKQSYIDDCYDYSNFEPYQAKQDEFKLRNRGTARNMIGINNGYTLKIQNVFTTLDDNGVTVHDNMYYGPIVGVAEVKLLTLVQGEGGGYVYADNVHEEKRDGVEESFMNTSGNFVFPGTVVATGGVPQNVVDDCFPYNFGHEPDVRDASSNHPAHYWYVQGNKYWFTNTITGYTSNNGRMTFRMDNVDQIISLSGTPKGSKVRVREIKWTHEHTGGEYECDIEDTDKDYTFMLGISDEVNYNQDGGFMTVQRTDLEDTGEGSGRTDMIYYASESNVNLRESPLLSMQLIDNVQNNDKGYYQSHLNQPCRLRLVLESGSDETLYTYTIDVDVKYLQGPRVDGYLHIDNCALPGELIHAEVNDLAIETDESMPVSGTAWEVNHGDNEMPDWRRVVSTTAQTKNEIIDLLAQHRYDGRELRYVVMSSNQSFPVLVRDDAEMKALRVHNYHDMKYVNDVRNNRSIALSPLAGARLYIRNREGWDAFVDYLNAASHSNALGIPEGLAGMKIYLQCNIELTETPSLVNNFAGEFNGDGYVVRIPGGSLFANSLAEDAKVYNLGVVGGTVCNDASLLENCFDANTDAMQMRYGRCAFALSHEYSVTDPDDSYINGNRFARGEMIEPAVGEAPALYDAGDWQYARWDDYDPRMLRTDPTPNYGSVETAHNVLHTAADITDHDCLFFGQTLTPSGIAELPYPQHISDSRNTNGTWAETNRVYETEGYYRSSVDGRFYYNTPVAWALQPGLTAVRFDNSKSTANGEQRKPQVFGNSDRETPSAAVGYQHVTRNLLVYEADDAVAATGSADFLHVTGSKGALAPDATASVYTCDNMTLADKEDFNAPYSFTATEASYVRDPRTETGYAETVGSAWQSLALPFAPTHTTLSDGIRRYQDSGNNAMIYKRNMDGTYSLTPVSQYGETQSVVTHFWGNPTEAMLHDPKTNDRSLNHEYWLRELSSVSDMALDDGMERHTYALFQRPLASTDDPSATYADAFVAYKPYIVSFPGTRYYEFDMTGKTITFSARDAVIAVTDDAVCDMEVSGVTHTSAFLASERGDATYAIELGGNGGSFVSNQTIFPFRTYITAMSTNDFVSSYPQCAKEGMIFIGRQDAALERMAVTDEGDRQPDVDVLSLADDYLHIYSVGRSIVVESGCDRILTCYGISGTRIATWQVRKGINTFSDLRTGIYAVAGHKIAVK